MKNPHHLLLGVYQACERLPEAERERFGQLLCAAARDLCVQVATLDDSGAGDQRALRCCVELEYLLLLAEELCWLSTPRVVRLLDVLTDLRLRIKRGPRDRLRAAS